MGAAKRPLESLSSALTAHGEENLLAGPWAASTAALMFAGVSMFVRASKLPSERGTTETNQLSDGRIIDAPGIEALAPPAQ